MSSASATHKSSGGGAKASAGKPVGSAGGSSRSNAGSSGGGGSGKSGESGGSCSVGNSFVPGTKVVMADGSMKAIEDVEAGDKVLATDPETGATTVETVTAEIKGEGLKHLVKVTIDTDGDRGDETASVTATDGHPFWVEELGDWIDATDLRSGQWLRTSAGTHVQISAIQRWTAAGETVHNLTVSDTHTYYVLAGDATVLVHNCGDQVFYPQGDDFEQGDLPSDAGIAAGSSLAAGEYTFIVRQDGSLRAMENYSMWDLNPDAGHTSLGDHQGVTMAGMFSVDESGTIVSIGNHSGHYTPNNKPGFNSLIDVTRRAFQRNGWGFADEAWEYVRFKR
ncbi:polymorphic toxin-type HINT domain-containing protein [Streptomyces pratensis]|uniref:polymorphic toxin-type HINT domain-containing protein n=1 Tax=Streptomyces pratensis TaxID=1169025 RepID=UPI003627C53C